MEKIGTLNCYVCLKEGISSHRRSSAGDHSIAADVSGIRDGMYFVRLKLIATGGITKAGNRKMALAEHKKGNNAIFEV